MCERKTAEEGRTEAVPDKVAEGLRQAKAGQFSDSPPDLDADAYLCELLEDSDPACSAPVAKAGLLLQQFGIDGAGLEDNGVGRLTGYVVSPAFEGMGDDARQELVAAALSPLGRDLVGPIVVMTPEEAKLAE